MDAVQFLYNETYKIHYFLVSSVLIILVTGIVYAYGLLFKSGTVQNRIPIRLQLVVAILFIVLCIFANITSFFRERTDYLSPLSSILTGAYFIVLGASLGIYTGSHLIGRGKALAVWLPAVIALLVCSVMYYGEYQLLGGTLYRFGSSFFFEGLPGIAVAPVDVLVILAAGAATAVVMEKARVSFLKKSRVDVTAG